MIVGFGGINPAGRSSFHHGYRRMVHDVLPQTETQPMFQGLSTLMGLEQADDKEFMLEHTLIRKIEKQTFDLDNISTNCKSTLNLGENPISFTLSKRQLPNQIPENWTIVEDGNQLKVTVTGSLDVLFEDTTEAKVSSAGQLPTGFNAGAHYNSRNHPKGIQLSVFGASDAIQSIGIEWNTLMSHIQPDEISVYAGSAVGQLDDFGGRGMLQSWHKGGRISSKQLPLMLTQMPADFINGYIINSVGTTGTNMGACATFHYNLRQGMHDIQSGRSRIVIVGSAEAGVEPEIMEGFRAMGALSEDSQIAKLDNSETADLRRSCRPFSDNAGFTIGESSQFFVLMDDELALKLGATIYGSVPDVFINADANKKSISSPGIGNYITVAKSMALAQQLLGKDGAKQSYVHAHGTGTPQNRVSESHILNEVAKTFNIEHWPVTAIKSYIGHSLGPSGGDQLTCALGVWQYGYIPSIQSIDHLASDVYTSNLEFTLSHKFVGEKGSEIKASLLNAKGFGGNNATALILSPAVTMKMLQNKYGESAIAAYHNQNSAVRMAADSYDKRVIEGNIHLVYDFGTSVMDENDLKITQQGIKLSAFSNELKYSVENPYPEYLEK